MDVVGVMAAYAAIKPTTSKYCTKLPDDGYFVIRNMLEHFKYFIILIVTTNYIFVHKLDNKVFICPIIKFVSKSLSKRNFSGLQPRSLLHLYLPF